jgi:hypothetical protein
MFIKNKLDSHVAVSHILISDYQVNRDIKIIMQYKFTHGQLCSWYKILNKLKNHNYNCLHDDLYFHGFPQSLQVNDEIVPKIRLRPLPTKTFSIRHSSPYHRRYIF